MFRRKNDNVVCSIIGPVPGSTGCYLCEDSTVFLPVLIKQPGLHEVGEKDVFDFVVSLSSAFSAIDLDITTYQVAFRGAVIHGQEQSVSSLSALLWNERAEALQGTGPYTQFTVCLLSRKIGHQRKDDFLAGTVSTLSSLILRGDTTKAHYEYSLDRINKTVEEIQKQAEIFRSSLDGRFTVSDMDDDAVFSFFAGLVNCSPERLLSPVPAPAGQWHHSLLDCEIDLTDRNARRQGLLPFRSPNPRVASVGSVKRFRGEYRVDSISQLFATMDQMPDFLCIVHDWHSYTAIEKERAFRHLRDELRREDQSFREMFASQTQRASSKEEEKMSTHLEPTLVELRQAERDVHVWGTVSLTVFASSESPAQLKSTTSGILGFLRSRNADFAWETRNLHNAYLGMFPGNRQYAIRRMPCHTIAAAAIRPNFDIDGGQGTTESNRVKTPPQLLLRTRCRTIYEYNKYIGGLSTVVGIGKPRSGKTTFISVCGSMLPSMGGISATIAYDDGSNLLADLYGDAGAVFDLPGRGFNPVTPLSSHEHSIRHQQLHLSRLIHLLLSLNEEQALQSLDKGEQKVIDDCISALYKLGTRFWNFEYLVCSLPTEIQHKLSRWMPGGLFGDVLNAADDDCLLRPETLVSVFNLFSVREGADSRRSVVLLELMHRINSAFSQPERRAVPKTIYVDEAHYALKDPVMADQLEQIARTMPKNNGSIELWTHTAGELRNLKNWELFRKAASTYVFLADHSADYEEYRDVFNLNRSDIDVIRSLQPQKELFIVHPDLNKKQVVLLDLTESEFAWTTSNPKLAQVRRELINRYGSVEGLTRFKEYLNDDHNQVA